MQNVIYVFSHLYFNPYPYVCKLVGHRLLIKEIIDRRQSKSILKYSITYSAESQAVKLASTLLCSVQFLRQPPHDLLMRSFISRHLVLRKRLIAHALCLARPDFKNPAWTSYLCSRGQSIFYTPAGEPSKCHCCQLSL